MTDNPFKPPAATSGITWEDHKGRLFLIEPKSVESGIQTTFGEKEAVRADVTVIDAPDAPEVFTDALIFPGVLISQTRSLLNEKVLGRLGQGVGKPNQKPPWRLEDATEDEIGIGIRYLDSRKPKSTNPFASTSSAQAEPPF
ncbi:MAG: hypothetical protein ACRDQH_02470 [Pseudonocardiaceae bacterium]